MFERRSLRFPITLGVVMIVLVALLIVGWALAMVLAAISERANPALFWVFLAVGTSLLVIVLVGVVLYLMLSIKAINLSRRQSNFIDSVTHELKTPIAALKLCLQTMTRQAVTDDERDDIQQYMLVDVERLDQLINHLLEAARTSRVTQKREIEDVRLDELLRECVHGVSVRYHVLPETFELHLEPWLVNANREDLFITFRNLIDNAVKYAGDQPHVRVTLVPGASGELLVQIEDNGRGIPPHLRRQVFGRFIRVGTELERDRPGTGLGLYIVRSLVQRMRCRVRVREGKNGIGTTFEVTLPAAMKPVRYDESVAPPAAEPLNA